MTITRRATLGLVVGAAAVPIVGSRPASAQTTIRLTMASSHPTVLPWTAPLETVVAQSNALLEERGSGYRIDWTEAYGGQLYGGADTLEAITQNIADSGWIGALFEPSALPLQNIMYSTPFVTSTVQQALDTMNTLNRGEQAMIDEWSRHDIMFFGSSVSDGYSLFLKEPMDNIADIAGRKILGAAATASYIEPLGARLVPGNLPEYYSQLQTGVGDGVLLVGTGAYPLKLHEVAPHAVRVDTGPLTFGGLGMNKSIFDSLPQEVQEVMIDMGAVYSGQNADMIAQRESAAWEGMAAAGATIREMPLEEKQQWADALPDLGRIWVEQNEANGVPARDIMAKFMSTVRDAGAEPLRDWAANI
ncbi:MAG: TRAP-type C4-dicarboxylate transport system, periplasmic component [Rhodobacteraceae bacterium HLUCCA08]|nr:MAG: TRAP-type C4-dicarboxylate transport system, periplasmic component [Rhodobacteraceae bacterium HLUCCA08]